MIGFMQGRLIPLVDGKIQAFPWRDWQQEIVLAGDNNFQLMEWTLDQERLYENPLLSEAGRAEILQLCKENSLKIASLTGDCFMHAPFWKSTDKEELSTLQRDFLAIVDASAILGIKFVVVPLVDGGRIENLTQQECLIDFLLLHADDFQAKEISIIFESDLGPKELASFIDLLPPRIFGINYDTGNSAALGYDAGEEIAAYGSRIMNIHIKDRVLGGTTVALGEGATDFDAVFKALGKINYKGDFILQTARAEDGDHAIFLCRYRELVQGWIESAGIKHV